MERRQIPGKILTTDYQNFSEPRALRKLAELSNITLKMYRIDEAQEGFHTKGYIFKNEELYRIIVGSSNLTLSALTKNKEWNTRVVSTDQGEYVEDLMAEFTDLWDSPYAAAFDDFIDEYSLNYLVIQKQRKIAKEAQIPSLEQYKLQPNSMQLGFIANLEKIRKAGESKDFDVDYLFSTMQMMAKPEILSEFRRDEFETIIIDEAHRTGAASYQNIMQYFTPKFWLGMTASPERTDSFDVYEAFDYNIAYEIRLQQALEENLLCPFHYFGITDLQIDGETVDEETGLKDFNKLTCDERVDYVIEQMEYYGYCGRCPKGLIFCSSKKEARTLSEKFNERGYRTLALTGEDGQEKQEQAVGTWSSQSR